MCIGLFLIAFTTPGLSNEPVRSSLTLVRPVSTSKNDHPEEDDSDWVEVDSPTVGKNDSAELEDEAAWEIIDSSVPIAPPSLVNPIADALRKRELERAVKKTDHHLRGLRHHQAHGRDPGHIPSSHCDEELKTGPAPKNFREVVTKDTYEEIISLDDLSYGLARYYTIGGERAKLDTKTKGGAAEFKTQTKILNDLSNKYLKIIENLEKSGWDHFTIIKGKTGKNNITDDPGASIIAYNSKKNIVSVVFHGSQSGSLASSKINGQGDWGTNWDNKPTKPASSPTAKGIANTRRFADRRYLPSELPVHRGFANNFQSMEKSIYSALKGIMHSAPDPKPWIIVSGHSKGAAMAGVAAPLIKAHFIPDSSKIKIGAILVSSPLVYSGNFSKTWVKRRVGKENIYNIGVEEDRVTTNGSKIYLPIGTLLREKRKDVTPRNILEKDSKAKTSFFSRPKIRAYLKENMAHAHYGSNKHGNSEGGYNQRASDFQFDPQLVMPYNTLQELLAAKK